jgi:hypothetical protein
VISFDTVVTNVNTSICKCMNESVKNELLKYMMKFCSSNLIVAMLGTVPSVYCNYRLIQPDLL